MGKSLLNGRNVPLGYRRELVFVDAKVELANNLRSAETSAAALFSPATCLDGSFKEQSPKWKHIFPIGFPR